MAKVKIFCDRNIRYKKQGLQSWNTVLGGITTVLNLDYNTTYELAAVTATRLLIVGEVENIIISKSDLSDINNSFKNNFFLKSIIINSSSIIQDASYAFRSDLNLENISITGLGTNANLTEIAFGVINANSATDIVPIGSTGVKDNALVLSNVINHVSNLYKMQDVSGSKNAIVPNSEIDLTKLDSSSDKTKFLIGSNVFDNIEIMETTDGNILRKKYKSIFDKSKDNNYNIELDLKSHESDSYIVNNNTDNSNLFDSNLSGSYNIELDLKQYKTDSYIINNNTDNSNLFDNTTNATYNIEIDIIPYYILQ
jgi:hypothetical protein